MTKPAPEVLALLWRTIGAVQIALLTTCIGLLGWTVRTVAQHETRITVIEKSTFEIQTEKRLEEVERLVDQLRFHRISGIGGS